MGFLSHLNQNLRKPVIDPTEPFRDPKDLVTDILATIAKSGTQSMLVEAGLLTELDLLRIKLVFGSGGGAVVHDLDFGLVHYISAEDFEPFIKDLSVDDQIFYDLMCPEHMVFVLEQSTDGSVFTYILEPTDE